MLHELIVFYTNALKSNQKRNEHERNYTGNDQEPIKNRVVDVVVFVVGMSLNCEVYVLVSGGGLRSCLLIVDCVIPARVINHNKNFICFGQMVQKFKVIFAVLCNCAVYYTWTHRQKVTALLYSIVSPKLSSHNKTVVIIVITRKEIEVKFVKN